ncbi:MAG: phenylacetate--CoA ligase family protein [Thermoplasmata archaeon]|nr:phenylacetate--CoA ligase family protein [Thermoplasmata archaeon]
MNPLSNPALLLYVAKSYLTDVDILRGSPSSIERYRNKTFKNVLKIAFKTPLYKEKYREAGLRYSDIEGLKDIHKLPTITKNDLRNSSYEDLIPEGNKKEKFYTVSTSGSTGKPITLFTEPYTMFKTLIGFVRIIKEHGIKWNKTRMAIIADLSSGSAEEMYFREVAVPSIDRIFSLTNIKVFHVGEDPSLIVEELSRFKPEFIGGYPSVVKIIASIINKDSYRNLKPTRIATSGEVLDEYTRGYIEDVFGTKIFDVYGATECSPIAFQCKEGSYHLNYDFANLEFIDDKGNEISSGKIANIVVTRLFGRGTPIIRYSGIDDLLVLSDNECDCGLNSPLIKRIEGRRVDIIVLADGRIIPPSILTGIPYKIMKKYNTKSIERFQIIQRDYDRIEVLAVISDEQKCEMLLNELRKNYQDVFGEGVEIEVKKVKDITEKRKDATTLAPVVVSKIKEKL